MNIIEYARICSKTFEEEPFNRMDALVLSQLAYTKYEAAADIVGDSQPLRDWYRGEYFDVYFSDGMTDDQNREMLAAAVASRRYRNILLCNLVSTTDESTGEQFAAMTFGLTDNLSFVSFRGTDGSLVGWKEDCRMTFRERVPAQKSAVDYINNLCANHDAGKGQVIIGGHSKGGNLAVYGAAFCDEEYQKRIVDVYSIDGPGFIEQVSDRIDRRIKAAGLNIIRIMPHNSVVGMLMESSGDYLVVKSNTIGLMQHILYTWQIEDGDLVFVDKLSLRSRYLDRTMRDWFKVATEKQRETFVMTFFGVLENADIQVLSDFQKLRFKDVVGMISEFKSCDEETAKVLEGMFKALIKSAAKQVISTEHNS
ncbi:MAG: DUF2974 domain-containing protein [Bacillota bacterium]|nr:DUF2974 domain-containing protein [Bacillota bacterium]